MRTTTLLLTTLLLGTTCILAAPGASATLSPCATPGPNIESVQDCMNRNVDPAQCVIDMVNHGTPC